MARPPALTPAQQKEATRRRAEGATLDELARSYAVGISTMRRRYLRRLIKRQAFCPYDNLNPRELFRSVLRSIAQKSTR
jgi:predicted RNA polymerase sigma factor